MKSLLHSGPPLRRRAVSSLIPKVKAFTLVEMVITLILVGILSAVIVPRFFNNSDYDSAWFQEGLITTARYAHTLAVSSGCHVQMSITSNSYQLNTDSVCLTSTTPSLGGNVTNPATFDTATMSGSAPSGVSITGFSGNLVFAPDGTIRNGSWNGSLLTSQTLTVTGGTSRTITLDGITGYVR